MRQKRRLLPRKVEFSESVAEIEISEADAETGAPHADSWRKRSVVYDESDYEDDEGRSVYDSDEWCGEGTGCDPPHTTS